MSNTTTVNYLEMDDARDLVDRIADRAENFGYVMSDNEKEAMAELLSDIGVKTSDLINVNNLADNYAIYAEIVSPSEAENYDNLAEDSLFSWQEEDGAHYCYQW